MSVEKKVPEIRFKGFSGDISTKNLKEIIITNTYGPRFNANDYDSNGNVKTIRGTDISIDGRVLYNQVPLASLEVNFIKEHILEDGDLVMITTADCGLTGLFEKQTDKYICSAYAVKVTLDQELASPLYFKYFFQTTLAKTEINKFIRKATVANLPASAILQIAHKIPCKKEQTAIGDYFQKLDNLINQHQQKHDKLRSIKKAMLEKMFPKQGETMPEIRFKGFSGEWEQSNLAKCTDLLTGNPFNSKEFINEGIFLVRGMNVKRGYLDTSPEISEFWPSSKSLERYLLKPEDIVIQMDGALIGKSYAKIKSSNLPAILVQRVTRVRCNEVNSEFIYQYIQKSFLSHIFGIKTETAVPHLSLHDIRNFSVFLPKKTEQTAIGNYFQKLDELINQHQQQITKLNNIKQACLSKMFV